jgi:hypothetical protein
LIDERAGSFDESIPVTAIDSFDLFGGDQLPEFSLLYAARIEEYGDRGKQCSNSWGELVPVLVFKAIVEKDQVEAMVQVVEPCQFSDIAAIRDNVDPCHETCLVDSTLQARFFFAAERILDPEDA